MTTRSLGRRLRATLRKGGFVMRALPVLLAALTLAGVASAGGGYSITLDRQPGQGPPVVGETVTFTLTAAPVQGGTPGLFVGVRCEQNGLVVLDWFDGYGVDTTVPVDEDGDGTVDFYEYPHVAVELGWAGGPAVCVATSHVLRSKRFSGFYPKAKTTFSVGAG